MIQDHLINVFRGFLKWCCISLIHYKTTSILTCKQTWWNISVSRCCTKLSGVLPKKAFTSWQHSWQHMWIEEQKETWNSYISNLWLDQTIYLLIIYYILHIVAFCKSKVIISVSLKTRKCVSLKNVKLWSLIIILGVSVSGTF